MAVINFVFVWMAAMCLGVMIQENRTIYCYTKNQSILFLILVSMLNWRHVYDAL